MNEEQEKEILNEAKIQTARHKKKIQIISLVAIIAVIAMATVACIARQALQPWSVSLITTVALWEYLFLLSYKLFKWS